MTKRNRILLGGAVLGIIFVGLALALVVGLLALGVRSGSTGAAPKRLAGFPRPDSRVNMANFVPPHVLSEDNVLAAAPFRIAWEQCLDGTIWKDGAAFAPFPELSLPTDGVAQASVTFDVRQMDLAGALRSFQHLDPLSEETPAETILRTLSPMSASLEQLALALTRPSLRFPLTYIQTFDDGNSVRFPYAFFARVEKVYTLRAMARLEKGDAMAAAQDVIEIIRLGRHLRKTGGVNASSTGLFIQSNVIDLVWVGLSRKAWTLEVVEQLAREFQGTDIFREAQAYVRLEHALHLRRLENMELGERVLAAVKGEALIFERTIDEIKAAQERMREALPMARPQKFDAKVFRAACAALRSIDVGQVLGNAPGRDFGTEESTMLVRIAHQTDIELCLSALALEKLRLVNGRFPATLDGLDLPNDVMTGESRKYEVMLEGAAFRLESSPWFIPGAEHLLRGRKFWVWNSQKN